MSAAMSETTRMLVDAAAKLFADLCTRKALDAAEQAFPRAMWDAAEAGGFPSMLAAEKDGGIGATVADAVAVLRVAGRHSVPLPLVETMVARWLASRAGVSIPSGPCAIAFGNEKQSWELRGSGAGCKLSGKQDAVAWGHDARTCMVVVPDGNGVAAAIMPSGTLTREARRNLAGEPRDRLVADGAAVAQSLRLGNVSHDKVFCIAAILRGAMIVGALEQVLELCVTYVPQRVQFGRPLSKLQAIQQQLAVLAGAVAVSAAITDAAANAIDRHDARLMVAVARARLADAIDTMTGIAHQVHGAIGFAREYMLHFSTRRLWAWRDEYGTAVSWREYVGRQFIGTPADELWPALAAVGSN